MQHNLWVTHMYQICLLTTGFILMVTGYDFRIDDKITMSPLELIDLIREEQKRNTKPDIIQSLIIKNSIGSEVESNVETTECVDTETMKNRKVWSRWSKWGECSVSCGSGTVKRRRVCVAGRCARGELEEQRRPCARAPCRQAQELFGHDTREME